MLWQNYALSGAYKRQLVPEMPEVYTQDTLPKGLIGVCQETGLVKVQVTSSRVSLMKFGKLLKKLGEPDEVIRQRSADLSTHLRLTAGAKLEFARTEDEIFDVYANGPRSCMSGSDAVRVYASDYTAVAYVKLGDRIVSRTVVCTDEDLGLQYVCIYGNSQLMKPLLRDAGYVAGDLEGCRLPLRCNDYGDIICPYLDCTNMVDVDHNSEEIVIDSCGEWSAQDTNGLLHKSCCEGCGEADHPDNLWYCDFAELQLCESCYNENRVYVDGESFHTDSGEIKQTVDDDWIREEHACWCENLDGYLHQDDCIWSEEDDDYYRIKDIVKAFVGADYEPDECYKGNCVTIRGVWVHEDYVEEYGELHDIREYEILKEKGVGGCPELRQGTLLLTEPTIIKLLSI